MRATQTNFRKNFIGFTGKVTVGEEHHLDATTQIFLTEEEGIGWGRYVSHVDSFLGECYSIRP